MKTIITIECEGKSDLLSVLSEIRAEIHKGYTKSSGRLPAIRPAQPVPLPCPPMPPGYPQPPQHCYPEPEEDVKELERTYYSYEIGE